jgi:hypothetical protein
MNYKWNPLKNIYSWIQYTYDRKKAKYLLQLKYIDHDKFIMIIKEMYTFKIISERLQINELAQQKLLDSTDNVILLLNVITSMRKKSCFHEYDDINLFYVIMRIPIRHDGFVGFFLLIKNITCLMQTMNIVKISIYSVFKLLRYIIFSFIHILRALCINPIDDNIELIEQKLIPHILKERDCAICLNSLESLTKLNQIITLQCGHFYHKKCISKYMKHEKEKLKRGEITDITCPLCRAPIINNT